MLVDLDKTSAVGPKCKCKCKLLVPAKLLIPRGIVMYWLVEPCDEDFDNAPHTFSSGTQCICFF